METRIRTALINAVLRHRGRSFAAPEDRAALDEWIKIQNARPSAPDQPAEDAGGLEFGHDVIAGIPVVEIGTEGAGPGGRTFVYVHGGSYVLDIAAEHWKQIRRLVRTTGVTAVVPRYIARSPGGPGAIVPRMADMLADVLARSPRAVVVAESAGGGVALAACQALVARGEALPEHLVMMSPWLDLTLSDPQVEADARTDLALSRATLALSARAYCAGIDPTDPVASPLNGPMLGLPPTTVFVGGAELVASDSRRFAAAARREGVAVELVEEPGLQHVYPYFPLLPQAARARERIAHIVAGRG